MPKRLYRIKRISDGLYSRGGCWPSFGKRGKVWLGLGPLKLHLAQFNAKDWPYGKDHVLEIFLVSEPVYEGAFTAGFGNFKTRT